MYPYTSPIAELWPICQMAPAARARGGSCTTSMLESARESDLEGGLIVSLQLGVALMATALVTGSDGLISC